MNIVRTILLYYKKNQWRCSNVACKKFQTKILLFNKTLLFNKLIDSDRFSVNVFVPKSQGEKRGPEQQDCQVRGTEAYPYRISKFSDSFVLGLEIAYPWVIEISVFARDTAA